MARPSSLSRLLTGSVVFLATGLLQSWGADEALIPARFNPLTDNRGNRWDINPSGAISDGTNDCFDNGLTLRVNGGEISFSRPMMTADGMEYVFSGRRGNLSVIRRIRLDAGNGALRYLEIFENTGTSPVRLPVTVHTDLGGNAMQITDTKDKLFFGNLQKDEGAFIAMQSGGGRPGVVFLVADPKAKVKPTIQIRDNRTFEVNYTLEVPSKSSTAIVHYVAQRLNASAQDGKALLGAYYKGGRLTDRQIPKAYAQILSNFSVSSSNADEDSGPVRLLAQFDEMVEASGLNRDKSDGVIIDAGSKLAGTVTGTDFEISTAFGKAQIPFSDVAGIVGGAGVQKPIRVFLRNGEVLSGQINGAKLTMATDTGLSFAVDLAQIDLLTMRRSDQESTRAGETASLIATHQGDRLAVADGAGVTLGAATPWGMVNIPISEVESLVCEREPFPAHRLTTADGSKLLVMLRGEEWMLNTSRFGAVKIVPQSVREIRRAGAKPKATDDSEESPQAGSYCTLVGQNRLTGIIDLPELHLASDTSLTALDPKQIVLLEGEEGSVKDVVRVKLADGQELRGRLTEAVLPIRSGQRTWRVPVVHIVAVNTPQPAQPSADLSKENKKAEAAATPSVFKTVEAK